MLFRSFNNGCELSTIFWRNNRSRLSRLKEVGSKSQIVYSTKTSLHFRMNFRNKIVTLHYVFRGRESFVQIITASRHCIDCSVDSLTTFIVSLHVSAPAVLILDENEHVISERHYKVDSSLHLICRASQLAKSDGLGYLNWYKEDRLLPGSDSRVKIK